ncbi:hypothetical protein T265_11078 [Opisthorchis viverrini]|uniref:Uncharacterized protein n=1 Tax=Opisthorchis viverrini TaxID=6198 RepID=A0A074YZZ3_OPIVI|nr:hypothetical protein T265_11078 [Opisthorchis viverrini]KER20361.1 hypothetical protein T265_11078 [Opisthorchis viverrini]
MDFHIGRRSSEKFSPALNQARAKAVEGDSQKDDGQLEGKVHYEKNHYPKLASSSGQASNDVKWIFDIVMINSSSMTEQ